MTIEAIKKNIGYKKGKNIKVKVNGSRNKKEEYNGIITEVYNSIFVIKCDQKQNKSFCYSDILTKTIEIFYEK